MRRTFPLVLATLIVLLLLARSALAQNNVPTNQTQKALEFYGGRTTLGEMPRRSAIRPTAIGEMSHSGKPFATATTGPTVSPYLNLFRDENETNEAVPSYYSFVRPQLEQQATAEQQRREISQLQRQLQHGTQFRSSTLPGDANRARFMDTAQFYGGWQR